MCDVQLWSCPSFLNRACSSKCVSLLQGLIGKAIAWTSLSSGTLIDLNVLNQIIGPAGATAVVACSMCQVGTYWTGSGKYSVIWVDESGNQVET